MKKRIFSILTFAVLSAVGLSSCALAEDCQSRCNHLYGFKKRTEPTCTSDGRIYHDCIKCFDTETIEVIPKLGHDFYTTYVNSNGCLGYREEVLCTRCNSGDGEVHPYYGINNNAYYCYIHDYDFENPVSVTVNENDPECVVYEYKCKNAECTENNTVKLHKWDAETLSWYEENKDSGREITRIKQCETCNMAYYGYVYGLQDGYSVIKAPENSNDYALVGFLIQNYKFGRCVKLTYAEYNRLISGEKINLSLPNFI